jgi:hypothetical protein
MLGLVRVARPPSLPLHLGQRATSTAGAQRRRTRDHRRAPTAALAAASDVGRRSAARPRLRLTVGVLHPYRPALRARTEAATVGATLPSEAVAATTTTGARLVRWHRARPIRLTTSEMNGAADGKSASGARPSVTMRGGTDDRAHTRTSTAVVTAVVDEVRPALTGRPAAVQTPLGLEGRQPEAPLPAGREVTSDGV